jgi:hypothetical protein
MSEKQKFIYIFYFLCGSVFLVFVYIFLITFLHIPKDNIRFADTSSSFLLGAVIGGSFGYLVTGSANHREKTDGNTTAKIKAEISATQKPEEGQN